MDKNFWQKKWNDNEIGFHQKETTPLLREFFSNFTKNKESSSKCLVPLCGKSNDLLYLKNYFSVVTGVEIIYKAIDSFFKENDLKPTQKQNLYIYKNIEIAHSDFFSFPKISDHKYDFIFDRASMIALPKNLREKYSKTIQELMSNQSTLLLITLEYDSRLEIGPPFSVPESEVRMYYKNLDIKKVYDKNLQTISQKFRDINVQQKVYIINKY